MKTLMIGLTPPLEGGSERVIYELSSRTNSVVLTQKNSICKNKIGLPIIYKPQLAKSFSFLFSSFVYAFFLLFTFRKKYDIIHIHENLLYFLVPMLKFRYKVLVTIHGIKGFKFHDNKYLWFIFRIPLKFADHIIAVNLEDKKELDKEFSNVTYIPNGVDLSLYETISIRTSKKISFIGRVHEQKGIIYLLQAFDLIKEKYPDFKLEIIGKIDEYAKELQKKYPDKRITWKGFLTERADIVKSLKSAYCIVLPSLWEGLPLTLFESLASSRPVIVSDIQAFKSVIKDQALFFKVKNPKDLADKISSLIDNKNQASSLARKGKILSKDYDWNEIAKKTMNLYKNVI